eukprot:gene4398-3199_t
MKQRLAFFFPFSPSICSLDIDVEVEITVVGRSDSLKCQLYWPCYSMDGDGDGEVPDAATTCELFTTYMTLESEKQRQSLAARYPAIFLPEIVAELSNAAAEMECTRQEVNSAYAAIDGVADALQLPAFSEVREAEAMNLRHVFTEQFSSAAASLQRAHTTACHSGASAWYKQPELVLRVLSFLPAEDVLRRTEDVCAAWRYWLSAPEVSRAFWIDVVQREFPDFPVQHLDYDSLLQQDWRSFAMACIPEITPENERGEAASSSPM